MPGSYWFSAHDWIKVVGLRIEEMLLSVGSDGELLLVLTINFRPSREVFYSGAKKSGTLKLGVQPGMAGSAQSNEVKLVIRSQLSTIAKVVHFELLESPTVLASPTIALKYLPSQLLV